MDAAETPPAHDLFVARQPIFDLNLKVVAYELLFRNSPLNSFPNVNGDNASAQTIHRALNVFGLEALAGNRRLFFNVTRQVLLGGLMHSLPPALTTVEILESVVPDAEVVAACRALKKAGFALALDDFIFSPGYEPLIELADIIKVDFLQTLSAERAAVVSRHARPGCQFLAEKIESSEEQADAIGCGYSLLQGYFFARPQMLSAREIPTLKVNYLRLLQLVNDPDFDAGRLQEVIKQDVSLSVKLLTYLNSAMFGWYQRVTSIQQALVLLGERPFRKWVAVLAVAGLGGDLPHEVVVMSLVRARFCEQLAASGRQSFNELDLFLLGMLSLLDVMTGRPIAEMIAQLRISEQLRAALLSRAGPMGMLLDTVQAFERADWDKVEGLAKALGIDETAFAAAYRESVEWADKVYTG
jgi:c-di-GMP-related signal transduction protein